MIWQNWNSKKEEQLDEWIFNFWFEDTNLEHVLNTVWTLVEQLDGDQAMYFQIVYKLDKSKWMLTEFMTTHLLKKKWKN